MPKVKLEERLDEFRNELNEKIEELILKVANVMIKSITKIDKQVSDLTKTVNQLNENYNNLLNRVTALEGRVNSGGFGTVASSSVAQQPRPTPPSYSSQPSAAQASFPNPSTVASSRPTPPAARPTPPAARPTPPGASTTGAPAPRPASEPAPQDLHSQMISELKSLFGKTRT